MTYREKFEASEHRAHYQNIATKILREMNDLRSKAQDSPLVPRRWIWELIQNAKEFEEDKNKLFKNKMSVDEFEQLVKAKIAEIIDKFVR